MSDTLLVTGGAGFIGSEFVRQVINETDSHVIVLDALTYAGNKSNLASVINSPNLTFVEGDICDRPLVQQLLTSHGCTAVVNFAAETHVDRSIGSPNSFLKTNVMGTFELLEASLAHWKTLDETKKSEFRFLHVSTDEVYGSLGEEGSFTETTSYAPNSPYSASKAASDHFVRAYHSTYGLPILITNCSNNYGPFQFPEKLIPLMVQKAVQGETLPVYGDGSNVRDWLHVTDHAQALRLVLQKGQVAETYNIGGGAEMSNIEVVTKICQHVNTLCPNLPHAPCSSLIRYVEDRPGHDFRYSIDASKIRKELGWTPQMTFEEGIRTTVEWYLSNEEWISTALSSADYDCDRLGLSWVDNSSSNEVSECLEPIEGINFRPLKRFHDDRGWLLELFRIDELPFDHRPEMSYVSETLPNVTRGPHEHVEQSDYFAFVGPGDLSLYLWDARKDSPTSGNHIRCVVGESNPVAVIVPPGVVHAYKNIGDKPAQVFNAPDRLYAGHGKNGPVDEIRYEEATDSPFVVN